MKHFAPGGGLVLILGILIAVWAWKRTEGPRLIPCSVVAGIPAECRQLVLAKPRGLDAVAAEVWLLARRSPTDRWRVEAGPMEASVGKKGSAWGLGAALPMPPGYREKREGDGRSPAGVFAIPAAFGTASRAPSGVTLPWLECTPTLRGVDDPASRYYNRIVDEAAVPDKDWTSAETMRRADGLYDWGAIIDHNAAALPGAGSCIFLHIWKGPNQGTAGCTALDRAHVEYIIRWLRPGESPRFALAVEGDSETMQRSSGN